MKNPSFRFVLLLVLVLLLDFAGDFEDEDDDENEEDCASGYFSHRLWTPRSVSNHFGMLADARGSRSSFTVREWLN